MKHVSIPQPPRPKNDLRTQLTGHVINAGIEGLESGERRRAEAAQGRRWDSYRDWIRTRVAAAFGPMPFGRSGGSLNARTVSGFDTRHCRIENVLFESYPSWEVNASVFIPKGKGPFPAVVLPVGHSGKQFGNYQIPAQAFASLGFMAVLFDPPGQSSEKQRGNDHFRDGVRSSLFGITSNRFFVLDALRCIDYLETRNDADLTRGVGMSGVSGGGVTTLFASLFDPRIVCFGPSCCLNRMADHPVGDLYSTCPECLWLGRLRDGIDNVDVALASVPKPMLFMAGKLDEVFAVDATRHLAESVSRGFTDAGYPERFEYFEDECGHAYTLEQTARFAAWMNRWLLSSTDTNVPTLSNDDFEMLDYEMLRCRPSEEVNMYSIHRDLAKVVEEDRKARRSALTDPAAVLRDTGSVVGVVPAVEEWRESEPFRLWSQGFSEALARVEDLDIPVSVFRPWEPKRPHASVLYIDDAGRKASMEAFGPASRISRMFERDEKVPFPEVFTADLPGWGEGEPLMTPYQAAGWGSMDRILAYLSLGNGDGILCIASRCAAALAKEIAGRNGLGPHKTIIAGRGLGAVAALLAAAIVDIPCSVVAVGPPASFRLLLEEEHYRWPATTFLPGALPAFDLPEVSMALHTAGRKVLVINPRDGRAEPLGPVQTRALYGEVNVTAEASPEAEISGLLEFVDTIAFV